MTKEYYKGYVFYGRGVYSYSGSDDTGILNLYHYKRISNIRQKDQSNITLMSYFYKVHQGPKPFIHMYLRNKEYINTLFDATRFASGEECLYEPLPANTYFDAKYMGAECTACMEKNNSDNLDIDVAWGMLGGI